MADTDQLIRQLAASAKPVRRLGSPLLRTCLWTFVVVALIGTFVLVMGPRPHIMDSLSRTAALTEWIAAILTGLLAGYAVFEVSVPGSSPRWTWLPLPAVVLWLGGIGGGCLGDWARLGAEAFAFDSHGAKCLLMITLISVPLAVSMLLMVRHAGVVRPVATAALAGLSTAAFAAAGVSLIHAGETALMVLLWHGGAILLLGLTATALSRKVFAWIGRRKFA